MQIGKSQINEAIYNELRFVHKNVRITENTNDQRTNEGPP